MMVEVYRNGEPTRRLFMSEENAQLWIGRQYDGAAYTVEPFMPKQKRGPAD